LSRYSAFFHDLFDGIPTTGIDLAIPFDGCGKFPIFVDYLYTGELCGPHGDPKSVVGLLALAAFYDVPELVEMMKSVVAERLEEFDDPTDIYRLTELYNKFDAVSPFPEATSLVKAGIESMKLSQDVFVKYMVDNFGRLLRHSRSELFECVSSSLFASVLRACDLPNDDMVDLVEGYIGARGITDPSEFARFDSIVNWEDEQSFLLFSRYGLQWANASTSRRLISRLIDERRETVIAFDSYADGCARDQSRWCVFSWLQAVRDSSGTGEQPAVELIEYLSSLAGVGRPFDPCRFGLFDGACSPSLASPFRLDPNEALRSFGGDRPDHGTGCRIRAHERLEQGIGPQILFDYGLKAECGRSWHYCSTPDPGRPFVGLTLKGFCFDLTEVTFEYHKRRGAMYRAPGRLVLEARFRGRIVEKSPPERLRGGIAVFRLDVPKRVTDVRVCMEPKTNFAVLRADAIYLYGKFVGDALPIESV
jgi:hypothetical protein